MDYRDRYKWNKNSFISDSVYLKMYIDTLKRFFSVKERQTIYVISKYFTDGVEYARKDLVVADVCFEAGERLVNDLDAGLPPLLFDFIANIYNRSKSYYFHKAGDYPNARKLVLAAIENNRRLIASGHFDMLLFDSVSHYHNYSSLLKRNGQHQEAREIMNMLGSFLITNKPNALFGPDRSVDIIKDERYYSLKYSNIHTIVLMSLLKEVEQDGTEEDMTASINSWIPDMVVQTADDRKLKDWLKVYRDVSSGGMPLNGYNAEEFNQFLKNTPNSIMGLLADKIKLKTINENHS